MIRKSTKISIFILAVLCCACLLIATLMRPNVDRELAMVSIYDGTTARNISVVVLNRVGEAAVGTRVDYDNDSGEESEIVGPSGVVHFESGELEVYEFRINGKPVIQYSGLAKLVSPSTANGLMVIIWLQ